MEANHPFLNKWFNEPSNQCIEMDKNKLEFKVLPKTDFWQITHYNFSRTDGNCYVAQLSQSQNICFEVKVRMSYISEFDQAGVIVYYDEENFAKMSVEHQTLSKNKLGSVVTKNKRSDWATQNIDDITTIWYRISKRDNTYRFEYKFDETSNDHSKYNQIRLFDIVTDKCAYIGVYGASPLGEGFVAKFEEIKFSENKWFLDLKDIPEEYKMKN